MLSDHPADDICDVHALQAAYLCREIERSNRDHHVPVILGVSMHVEPSSAAYHVITTGRKQLRPSAPPKCAAPKIMEFCRGSAEVFWYPPKISEADSTIERFDICWRPGGDRYLSFKSQCSISAGDCIVYDTVVDEEGARKTVRRDLLRCLVSGLSSDTPYEFKVRAVNKAGVGEWSESSAVTQLKNPRKAKAQKTLEVLGDFATVQAQKETELMMRDDWNVSKAQQSNSLDPQTALTPRDWKGCVDTNIGRSRLLPTSTNPRQGWKIDMHGEIGNSLRSELEDRKRLHKSVLMDATASFSVKVSDTVDGRMAVYDGYNSRTDRDSNKMGKSEGLSVYETQKRAKDDYMRSIMSQNEEVEVDMKEVDEKYNNDETDDCNKDSKK